jgi:elongation factor 3
LYDITLQVSLSSRVAILGPNGSGKSTLVKLLNGDMEPKKGGEVWKHPNLVIGYVAQHAFHHIDNHLDKAPLEYMLWGYQTGQDLKDMTKASRQITAEEEQRMKDGALVVVEGQKRFIEEILSRKKLKQTYEYEVSFKNLSSSENIWMPRDDLVKRGFEKVCLNLLYSYCVIADSFDVVVVRKFSRLILERLSDLVSFARSCVGRLRSTLPTSGWSLNLFRTTR